ncbi:MAG TPA: hypothetical protein ENN17_04015 [bacterium]|nr:hypothetical protein [bacterium]
MNENTPVVQTLSVLFFPMLFQGALLGFCWGADDPSSILFLKRLFLLLPAAAFIAACWITIVSIFTVIFRHNRQAFLVSLIVTWWELAKSFFLFWGGIFRFVFESVLVVLGLFRIVLMMVWSIVTDIFFFPFRVLAAAARGVMEASVPWIALTLTLFWCLIEALIFTFVTTPLVTDVLYVATTRQISEAAIQVPLFVFLFFIVLASYAMLQSLFETARKKRVMAILGMAFVELFVMLVEVMFLYREFVDALVPWFAQYSEQFNPGPVVIILVAFGVWFGIRSLSWFLFASKGTPFILKIIHAEKIETVPRQAVPRIQYLPATSGLFGQIRRESEWLEKRGADFLGALLVPPLQVIAAAVNFIVLLFTAKHLFELPLRTLADLEPSSSLIQAVSKEKPVRSAPRPEKGSGSGEKNRPVPPDTRFPE